MWHVETWFGGEQSSAGLAVELDDLKSLFQPKRFYDSMIPSCVTAIYQQGQATLVTTDTWERLSDSGLEVEDFPFFN